jgi:hypothetical protein
VRVGHAGVSLVLDHPKAKPNRQGEWQTRDGAADTLQLTVGQLGANAGYQAIWCDTDAAELESQLTDIGLDILIAGEAAYRAERQRRYEWDLEQRERLAAELAARRAEAERRAREQRAAEAQARRELLFSQA